MQEITYNDQFNLLLFNTYYTFSRKSLFFAERFDDLDFNR